MTQYNYLPPEEEKLTGIYRVSFEIQLGSQDDLALSDVVQALTEGFGNGFGEDFVTSKVADLSIEKITKKAVKVLKVGDTVLIKEPIKIKANIYSDDGYIFAGVKNEISEIVGENIDLNIEAGSIGYVNKIAGDKIEVVDLDKPIISFQEIGLDAVNVDLITVHAEQLEKIDSEEVK
jgi:hypothetical protein